MANRESVPAQAAARLPARSLKERTEPRTISTKRCAQEALHGEVGASGQIIGPCDSERLQRNFDPSDRILPGERSQKSEGRSGRSSGVTESESHAAVLPVSEASRFASSSRG